MKITPILAALGLALAMAFPCATPASAQQTAKVVSPCGSASYTAGTVNYETIDTTGATCGANGGSTPSAPIAPSASAAAESCHVYKAGAGTAFSLSGYLGAAAFILVFDSATAPADGAVTPKAWAYAPAQGNWSMNYSGAPAAFANGITACASSSGPLTKTAVSTNNVFSGIVQ